MPATTTPDHEALRALIHDRKTKKGVGRVTRDLDLCLDSNLALEHEQAAAAVEAAQERIDKWRAAQNARDAEGKLIGDRRMAGTPEPPAEMLTDLRDAEKVAAAAEKAKAPVTVKVTLAGIKSTEWDELVAANPKREGNDRDEEYGANRDAFLADLFDACCAKVEHAGEPFDVDPRDLFDGLSPGENAVVETTLMFVNKRQVSVSFSDAASQKNRPSAGKSRRR